MLTEGKPVSPHRWMLRNTIFGTSVILFYPFSLRWRSADGNDYLCGACDGQNEAGHGYNKPGSYGGFGPRSHAYSAVSSSSWKGAPKEQGIEYDFFQYHV